MTIRAVLISLTDPKASKNAILAQAERLNVI
jgi:hypothetical protein